MASKPTRRVAQPAGAPEVGQHGQHQDVAQRVSGGGEAHEQAARSADVRADQEDPRQQARPRA